MANVFSYLLSSVLKFSNYQILVIQNDASQNVIFFYFNMYQCDYIAKHNFTINTTKMINFADTHVRYQLKQLKQRWTTATTTHTKAAAKITATATSTTTTTATTICFSPIAIEYLQTQL